MKLPKLITILGQEYKIEEKTLEEIGKEVGAGTMGAVNYSERRILIGSDVGELDHQLVFLHECFHVLQFATGLSQSLSPEIQEVVAESFANGIIEILKQLDKAQPKRKQSKHGHQKKSKVRSVPRTQSRTKRPK